jgi:integrase/recombinase XerD
VDTDFSMEITLKHCRTPFKGKIIEKDEYCQILQKVNNIRDKCLLEILIKTGIRLGECAALNVESVKNENLYIVGKGNVERKINLNHIRESINLYLAYRNGQDGQPLFLSQKLNRLSCSQIQNIVHKYFGTNVHSLRHSFAVALLSSGADIVSIKTLLGHASILTSQIYVDHINEGRLTEALSKVA